MTSYKAGPIWVQTAEEGLSAPTGADIPCSEAVVTDYEQLTAAAYRLFLKEGQNLHVLVKPAHPFKKELPAGPNLAPYRTTA